MPPLARWVSRSGYETLAGAEVDALVTRVRAMPEVPMARHFDGPRAFAAIENLLRARTSVDGG